MNYFKIYFPFLSFLILSACQPAPPPPVIFDLDQASRVEEYQVSFLKEIDIPFPEKKKLIAPYFTQHDNWLYIIEKDSIAVFDLPNYKFIRRFGIEGSFNPSHPFSGIHLLSADSIIVFNSHKSFLLLDENGKQRKQVVFKPTDLPYRSQVPTVFPSIRIQSQGQKILFPYYPFNYSYLHWEHYKTPRIAIYDLAKDTTQFLAPTSPSAYIEKGYQLPISIIHPDLLTVDNRVFVSYLYDHVIEVYNLNGTLLQRKSAPSRYISKFPEHMTFKEHEQQQNIFNYRSTTPLYGELNYHADLELYSRIVLHEKALKNKEGKLIEGDLRNASILLLNKEMDIVGESLFETGPKGLTIALPLPNGFLIAPSKDYWPEGESLVFSHQYIIQPNSAHEIVTD